ncbi:hypothetical protein AB0B88_16075 [Micromonospora haikouensis]|uniref:hypothetical protein n=1 Tax=Micromonospora haikouensis TaxID=686309 RepID=UPI0033FF2E1C
MNAPSIFKGNRLVRGPMASDHYTHIHNLAVRGAIPTRYVGVFGFISSHQEGWNLTAATVAAQLEVGVDFVTSALHSIEAAGCLIRTRERDEAGKVHGSIWFITDLPLQLRQLGITDEALIRAQVQAAYEKWRAEYQAAVDAESRAAKSGHDADEPNRENPILAATSGNAARGEGFPSSEPNPGFPVQAQPDQAEPVHKKTKGKKTKVLGDQEEEHPPSVPPDTHAPAAAQAHPGEGEGDSPDDPKSEAGEVLDEVFRTARLPRAKWSTGQRREKLLELIAEKITAGWHPDHLTAALSESMDGVTSVYGVVRYRIGELGTPPRRPAPTPPPADAPPACAMHPMQPAGACKLCKLNQAAAEPAPPIAAGTAATGAAARREAAEQIARARQAVKARESRTPNAMAALDQLAAEVTARPVVDQPVDALEVPAPRQAADLVGAR